MIIDFHTHNFPDALAQRAIAAMLQRITRAIPFKPVGNGTLGRQLADMKADGIDRAAFLIAVNPDQFSARCEALQDFTGMSAAAERSVEINAVRPDIQKLYGLR